MLTLEQAAQGKSILFKVQVHNELNYKILTNVNKSDFNQMLFNNSVGAKTINWNY